MTGVRKVRRSIFARLHIPRQGGHHLSFGDFAMNCLSRSLLIALMAAIAVPAWAAAGKKDRKNDPTARISKKLDGAGLSADSLAKAKKVIADHAAKLKDAQAKADAVLTSEQKTAQKSAMQAAKTAGKKGKEAKAEIEAALKLTSEQKTKLAEAKQELAKEESSLNSDLKTALSSDEFAKLGLKTKKKKNA